MLELNKQNVKKILGILAFAILLFCAIEKLEWILKAIRFIWSLIFPFVLGACIAFILNVPTRRIETLLHKRMKKYKNTCRVLAFLFTLVCLVGILLIAFFVVIPELVDTITSLTREIPRGLNNLQKSLESMTAAWPALEEIIQEFSIDWGSLATKAVKMVQTAATGIFNSGFWVIRQTISGVTTFFISFAFSIYVLFQKEKLGYQLRKILYALLPKKVVTRVLEIAKLTEHTFSNFLSGQCLEALILGTMFFLTMSIFRMPYAMLMGILIALTALIPIFGAFIGCAIGVFLLVMINPMQALAFLIMFLILQQIEGNLIYPHVVGNSVGLPSIWVLFAVSVGGELMGIAGMLIFIPLCSVCYALLREGINKRLKEKKIQVELKE